MGWFLSSNRTYQWPETVHAVPAIAMWLINGIPEYWSNDLTTANPPIFWDPRIWATHLQNLPSLMVYYVVHCDRAAIPSRIKHCEPVWRWIHSDFLSSIHHEFTMNWPTTNIHHNIDHHSSLRTVRFPLVFQQIRLCRRPSLCHVANSLANVAMPKTQRGTPGTPKRLIYALEWVRWDRLKHQKCWMKPRLWTKQHQKCMVKPWLSCDYGWLWRVLVKIWLIWMINDG